MATIDSEDQSRIELCSVNRFDRMEGLVHSVTWAHRFRSWSPILACWTCKPKACCWPSTSPRWSQVCITKPPFRYSPWRPSAPSPPHKAHGWWRSLPTCSTGIMNLLSPLIGGVLMCHSAGGMAGHVRFGAHTGVALITLGILLLVMVLFFSSSIGTLFRILPKPVLGVILFLTGAQLALGTGDQGFGKKERFTMMTTAAFYLEYRNRICFWCHCVSFAETRFG